jgi:hypothetical protein
MIITRLAGGMGNQMFQYAFGRYLSVKYNTELKMDITALLDRTPKKHFVYRDYDLGIFNIAEAFATAEEISRIKGKIPGRVIKLLNKFTGAKFSYIVETGPAFSPVLYNSPDNVYLAGYWQTEKYFSGIADVIRKEFVVKEKLSDLSTEMLKQIQQTNSICVNVRRGDFITNPFHNVCDLKYYTGAKELISSKVDDPHFFIFSDDIEWCRENLDFFSPTTYVLHEYAGKKFQDYIRLISACKHFIIPNSSFAWWANYLSPSQGGITIAPNRWVTADNYDDKDVYRENWIKI